MTYNFLKDLYKKGVNYFSRPSLETEVQVTECDRLSKNVRRIRRLIDFDNGIRTSDNGTRITRYHF